MVAGENPDKVINIVKGNMANLQALYHPIIASLQAMHAVPLQRVLAENGDALYEQEKTMHGAHRLLALLPSKWQALLHKEVAAASNRADDHAMIIKKALNKLIFNVVQGSSTSQTLKGIATAGVKKSVIYSAHKLGKMWDGYVDRK